MKTKLLTLSPLWEDLSIAAGIVALSALLGFYAHQFALPLAANVFGDWGMF